MILKCFYVFKLLCWDIAFYPGQMSSFIEVWSNFLENLLVRNFVLHSRMHWRWQKKHPENEQGLNFCKRTVLDRSTSLELYEGFELYFFEALDRNEILKAGALELDWHEHIVQQSKILRRVNIGDCNQRCWEKKIRSNVQCFNRWS